jgi:peptide/nickel transport system permease protein
MLILRRVGTAVLTFFLVSVLVFVGTNLLPGDVAQMVLGQSATAETLQALREAAGLNQSAFVRYIGWLYGFLTGDLGVSLVNQRPISEMIGARLGYTLALAAATTAVVVPLALALGIFAAVRQGSRSDRAITVAALTAISVPDFFVASTLVLLFSVTLKWLPAVAVLGNQGFMAALPSLVLPVATLTCILLAQMTRMTRAALINVMSSPYIETARLKGASSLRLIWLHAMPNAIGAIANVIALNLAYLVGGVVIVESIFSYPGIAKLTVDAVATRDMPLVQACAMIFCSGYLLLVLAADLIAILANPRLRAQG